LPHLPREKILAHLLKHSGLGWRGKLLCGAKSFRRAIKGFGG
jgi:hypothetical protein